MNIESQSRSHVISPVLLRSAAKGLMDPVDLKFVCEFQESCCYYPAPPAFLDQVIEESSKLPADVRRAALQGMLEMPPAAGIEVPT